MCIIFLSLDLLENGLKATMRWPLDSKFYEISVEECINLSEGIENEEILAEPRQLRRALQIFLNYGVSLDELETSWKSKTEISVPMLIQE